jgi:hypothetical protein
MVGKMGGWLPESTLLSADPYQVGSEPLSITKDKPPRF